MKTIKLIGFLLLSIIVQISLIPFRLVKLIFTFLIVVFKILESTMEHIISEIKKETINR